MWIVMILFLCLLSQVLPFSSDAEAFVWFLIDDEFEVDDYTSEVDELGTWTRSVILPETSMRKKMKSPSETMVANIIENDIDEAR
ncbi:hypothetical protein MPTK1_2g11760 [Marchantia polymorpha subsp. ruderalis]|uniref:Uncharacterized protein n=1 Tax=Marchantia polymorpha TaxID=3197 RepID=A0A2R6XCL6_MARPO|nr:hypothetical protein MARPO_0023s0142 [Marchantia polymorpha]BBN01981.1 hypothetical protein Mp_2g11760 [Marchantia polymorpha subsp. ruderalis]|eukprot:PTQ43843.1 hypothetical protein MARPO_0023s0142 [Marchantia polymorpha]